MRVVREVVAPCPSWLSNPYGSCPYGSCPNGLALYGSALHGSCPVCGWTLVDNARNDTRAWRNEQLHLAILAVGFIINLSALEDILLRIHCVQDGNLRNLSAVTHSI